MREMFKIIRKISNEGDYAGKYNWISLFIIILSFIVSYSGELYYIILSHVLMLTWISCSSFQVFSLHERKKTDFVWCISNYSASQMILLLFSVTLLQSIVFMPIIMIHLIFVLKASAAVAVITGVVHYLFAIAVGSFMSVLFRSKYVGIILNVVFFLILWSNGLKWTDVELYRIISPIVQLYNMYMADVINILGLTAVTIVMCSFVWIRYSFSVKRISYLKICGFLLSVLLLVSAVFYEDYRNKVVMISEYKTVTASQILLSYRGIAESEAKQYAKMLTELDHEFYRNGITDKRLDQLVIQKYTAPIYLEERRIPFQLKDNVMHINIFSNGMLNKKDADLVIDMFLRMAVQIIINHDPALMDKRETYGEIYSAINKAIQNDMIYSKEVKEYAKKIAYITSVNRNNIGN